MDSSILLLMLCPNWPFLILFEVGGESLVEEEKNGSFRDIISHIISLFLLFRIKLVKVTRVDRMK